VSGAHLLSSVLIPQEAGVPKYKSWSYLCRNEMAVEVGRKLFYTDSKGKHTDAPHVTNNIFPIMLPISPVKENRWGAEHSFRFVGSRTLHPVRHTSALAEISSKRLECDQIDQHDGMHPGNTLLQLMMPFLRIIGDLWLLSSIKMVFNFEPLQSTLT
jgi:hypothetical protein